MMRRLISWFREHLFPGRDRQPDLGQTGVRVRPPAERPKGAAPKSRRADAARETDLRFDAEMGGRVEDGGPGKNVYVRSKYLREDTGTHEKLKIIDGSLLEDEVEEGGFDPYNTGQFDRSKNWNSRFRK